MHDRQKIFPENISITMDLRISAIFQEGRNIMDDIMVLRKVSDVLSGWTGALERIN